MATLDSCYFFQCMGQTAVDQIKGRESSRPEQLIVHTRKKKKRKIRKATTPAVLVDDSDERYDDDDDSDKLSLREEVEDAGSSDGDDDEPKQQQELPRDHRGRFILQNIEPSIDDSDSDSDDDVFLDEGLDRMMSSNNIEQRQAATPHRQRYDQKVITLQFVKQEEPIHEASTREEQPSRLFFDAGDELFDEPPRIHISN